LLLPLLTGIFVLANAMYQKMCLEEATNQGVQALALNQNISTTNPCTLATTAIQSATDLNSSLITITFYNGAAPPGAGTAISGSNCQNLLSGTQVSVYASYPCTLVFYNFYRNCLITAVQSEQVP
jgi:hypothetical protein